MPITKRDPKARERAYAVFTVKAIDDEKRIITGTATTPTPDRVGDIVDPMGVEFKNPLPLLHQHNSDEPIGRVTFDKPTKNGITFTARLPKIEEPPSLKDRIDTAWGEVKAGLVRGASIGFRPIEWAWMEDGGIHFQQTEVLELSLVTIPANADCTIDTIKSIDVEQLRAASGKKQKSGTNPPGVSGSIKLLTAKDTRPMAKKTVGEHIAALDTTRAKKTARMEEIMAKVSDEERSTDEAEREEFDTLTGEVKALDEELVRFRTLEKTLGSKAKPIVPPANEDEGTQQRAYNQFQVKTPPKLAPGIRFARIARCIGLANGSRFEALKYAEMFYKDDDAVQTVMKAAVGAGTTLSGSWAEDLVSAQSSVFADFVEFLRPATILGRFGNNGIPALRRVPFRTRLVGQTGGGAGYWVGQGAAKPLTSFDFSSTTLDPLKVANIAVVSEETLRDSSPAAEPILRDSLRDALVERMDLDFINPAKAAVANVSPASITNGITPIPSTGGTADDVRADIRALMMAFIAANNAPANGVWIMSEGMALSLSQMRNPLGQKEFADINVRGGSLEGLPVITSQYMTTIGVTAGEYVVLVNASDIYLGDDGEIAVDFSREASLQMDNAPTMTSVTPTGTTMVSMWQTNSVAFRAERTIAWKRRRDTGVQVLSAVGWGTGT